MSLGGGSRCLGRFRCFCFRKMFRSTAAIFYRELSCFTSRTAWFALDLGRFATNAEARLERGVLSLALCALVGVADVCASQGRFIARGQLVHATQ